MGILVVYGETRIARGVCPCGSPSLIIDNKYLCCNIKADETISSFKFEVTPNGNRKLPSKEYRDKILEKQSNKCIYCDQSFGEFEVAKNHRLIRLSVNWDHLIPFSYIKENPDDNFVAACQICNGIKHNKIFDTLEEAQKYVISKRTKNQKIWTRKVRQLYQRIHKGETRTKILQQRLQRESLEKQTSKDEGIFRLDLSDEYMSVYEFADGHFMIEVD